MYMTSLSKSPQVRTHKKHGVLGVLTAPLIRPALGARAFANFMAKYIVRWDANAFLLDR